MLGLILGWDLGLVEGRVGAGLRLGLGFRCIGVVVWFGLDF